VRPMMVVGLLVAVLGAAAAAAAEQAADASAAAPPDPPSWTSFMRSYARSYPSDAERMHRRAVFATNLAAIEAHNAQNLSWSMGITPFTDLTHTDAGRSRLLLPRCTTHCCSSHQT
jgi:hypothetical protein